MLTAEQPKKRRGRPPKARPVPEGADANPELTTAPDPLQEVLEAPRKAARPSAPILAKEVMDFLLDRYDWKPGEWRTILTTFTLAARLGGYFSQRTRKQ